MGAVRTISRKRPFRLTEPVVREHPLQRQIAALLTIEIAPPGHASNHRVWWCSIDHANYGGVPGTRVRRGIIAGIPDFYIEHRGRAHWIELKSAVGRLTSVQREVAGEIAKAEGRTAVARSADDVLAILDRWGIPRAGRARIAA